MRCQSVSPNVMKRYFSVVDVCLFLQGDVSTMAVKEKRFFVILLVAHTHGSSVDGWILKAMG